MNDHVRPYTIKSHLTKSLELLGQVESTFQLLRELYIQHRLGKISVDDYFEVVSAHVNTTQTMAHINLVLDNIITNEYGED